MEKPEQILNFVRAYLEAHFYAPSIREIQDACGISSTSVVDYNLKKLERAGLIRRDPSRARAIVLLDEKLH